MLAMALASMGWGCWWLELLAWRFFPAYAPSLAVVGVASSLFAFAGLVAAVLALRGRNVVWLAITAVPLLANLSLLAVPFLIPPDFAARG
jgi:hypothetical protein